MLSTLASPSVPVATTGDLFQAFNNVDTFTSALIKRIPTLADDDVIQTRERASNMGKAAWRIECACDAEIIKRTQARRGRGNVDAEGVGVMATVFSVAADAGVSPQTILRNAQIHKTFFGGREENTLNVESILEDKSFYIKALSASDPHAAIEMIAENKSANPFYSARDAERDIDAPMDSTYEWYTPMKYVDAARRVMGGIDLDPASNAVAQSHINAGTFYTREQNGLSLPWTGRVWLNPPYSNPDCENFVQRAVQKYDAGEVTQAVILTNNCTDTAWFHLAARSCGAICLTRRRIGFWQVLPNEPLGATRQGQAFFYLGPDATDFIQEFSAFGLIVLPLGSEGEADAKQS